MVAMVTLGYSWYQECLVPCLENQDNNILLLIKLRKSCVGVHYAVCLESVTLKVSLKGELKVMHGYICEIWTVAEPDLTTTTEVSKEMGVSLV